VKIKAILLQLGVIWITLLGSSACEAQRTAREKVNLQYNSDKQTKFEELEPAEGLFFGPMHLIASNQSFDCQIEIKRVSIIERAPQSQNPSETIEVPKLSGSMSFPGLARIDSRDYGNFQEILTPLGGFIRVLFDYGDYSPMSQKLILPYTVPGYTQTYFGEILGNIKDGHFVGTWFSNAVGDVGTFDLVQNPRRNALQ
jgi:hypothetical protein